MIKWDAPASEHNPALPSNLSLRQHAANLRNQGLTWHVVNERIGGTSLAATAAATRSAISLEASNAASHKARSKAAQPKGETLRVECFNAAGALVTVACGKRDSRRLREIIEQGEAAGQTVTVSSAGQRVADAGEI